MEVDVISVAEQVAASLGHPQHGLGATIFLGPTLACRYITVCNQFLSSFSFHRVSTSPVRRHNKSSPQLCDVLNPIAQFFAFLRLR